MERPINKKMNNLLDTNAYDAQQTRINIIKTFMESTVAIFNSYPEALRLFSSFAERTVVQSANDNLLAIEEDIEIHIPVSSEGAVNALATGPTAESRMTAIQFRFYKNQFDIDEDTITIPKAVAQIKLFMLATVFAVELQSPLEIFRAIRGAPHSLEPEQKKNYWQNMIRQIGAGMLRDSNDTEGAARILGLRSLLVTADRDFSNVPRDQLFGIIVDWKTAGSIGITSEINTQSDLLKIANPSMFKVQTPTKVGDVIVESIPPYFREQIQQDTTLTMDHPLQMSFAGFVSIKGSEYAARDIRLYIPDYNGGGRYIRVPKDDVVASGVVTTPGHNGKNLLVVIRKAVITGSSHIVVFGKDKPVALAETAATKVRGGDGNDRDARNGMAYVSASRHVGATCRRPNNIVEFLSRVVRTIEIPLPDEKVQVLDLGDKPNQDYNVFIFRTSKNVLPKKDVFDLTGKDGGENTNLFEENVYDNYWQGKSLSTPEEHPLGYALSMPVAVTVDGPFVSLGPGGSTSSPLTSAGNTWTISPSHGPGLTLAGGVDKNYEGSYIITPPEVPELIQMYTSAYSLTPVAA